MVVGTHKPWHCLAPIIWAGLLLGMPYTLGAPVPCGAVSLGTSYAWVAVGLLTGGFIGTLCSHWLAVSHCCRAITVATTTGIVLLAILAVLEWSNVALLALGGVSEQGTLPYSSQPLLVGLNRVGSGGILRPLSLLLGNLVLLVVQCEGQLACLSAICCTFAWHCAFETRLTGVDLKVPVVSLVLAVAAGFLQPYAWLTWLPSSPLPIQQVYLGMDYAECWGHPGFVLALPCLQVCLILAAAAKSRSPHGVLRTAAAYALGILLFYALSNTWGGLLLPDEVAATVAKALYLVVAACGVVLAFARPRALGGCSERGGLGAMPEHGGEIPSRGGDRECGEVAWLLGLGLSGREVDAVMAGIRGVPLATAAKRLQVQPSTMREYARRAREKLGVSSLRDVRHLYGGSPCCGGAEHRVEGDSGRDGSPFNRRIHSIGLAACTAALALVGLPLWGRERYGELAGVAPLVLSLGCVAALCVPAFLSRSGLAPRRPLVMLAAAMFAGVCGLGAAYYWDVGDIMAHAARLACSACVGGTACLGLLVLGRRIPLGAREAAAGMMLASVVVLVACFDERLWLCATASASIAGAACLVACSKRAGTMRGGRAPTERATMCAAAPAGPCVILMYALTWSVLWGEPMAAHVTLSLFFVPGLAVSLGYCMLRALRRGRGVLPVCLASGVSVILLGAVAGWAVGCLWLVVAIGALHCVMDDGLAEPLTAPAGHSVPWGFPLLFVAGTVCGMFFAGSNCLGPIILDDRSAALFLLNPQGATSLAVGLFCLILAVACAILSIRGEHKRDGVKCVACGPRECAGGPTA